MLNQTIFVSLRHYLENLVTKLQTLYMRVQFWYLFWLVVENWQLTLTTPIFVMIFCQRWKNIRTIWHSGIFDEVLGRESAMSRKDYILRKTSNVLHGKNYCSMAKHCFSNGLIVCRSILQYISTKKFSQVIKLLTQQIHR